MIDIEKFICSLLADHPEGITVRNDIHKALKEQGLEYKDGKIVPIEDKESEDEKIRKMIISTLNRDKILTEDEAYDCVAWLEKQGQTFTKKDVDDAYLKGVCDAKHELEKQGEKKPVPKFKIGDTMRTLQEVKDGCTDGMPFVVSIDSEYYNCNSEKIAIKDQDDYEYPPMNRRQNPTQRKDFISIPFGAFDSELIEESITIPDGCYAVIEGRKVYIRKKVHSKKK